MDWICFFLLLFLLLLLLLCFFLFCFCCIFSSWWCFRYSLNRLLSSFMYNCFLHILSFCVCFRFLRNPSLLLCLYFVAVSLFANVLEFSSWLFFSEFVYLFTAYGELIFSNCTGKIVLGILFETVPQFLCCIFFFIVNC